MKTAEDIILKSSRQPTEDISEGRKQNLSSQTEIEFGPNGDVFFCTQALLKIEGHMLTPKSAQSA
jgi:peptide subunit release factor 1 (eRF1)